MPEPSPRDPDADPTLLGHQRKQAGRRVDLLAAIAVGGVLGAEARYAIGRALPHGPADWPVATLLVNVSGCLLIGVLMALLAARRRPHHLLRPFLGVGLLGGYTTFSTAAVEVVLLHKSGQGALAAGYLLLTPVAAVAAVWIGGAGTRGTARPGAR